MSAEQPESESIQDRRSSLKSQIRELGAEVDSYKTRTAAALGGGVFALLIAAGAVYDILSNKSSLWRTVGLSREELHWLAGLLTLAGAILLVIGIVRFRRQDRARGARLAALEEELAELGEQ